MEPVGEVLGIQPQSVSLFLGERRPEASWIVAKRNGKPTGYKLHQEHPDLKGTEIITSGRELRRRMGR